MDFVLCGAENRLAAVDCVGGLLVIPWPFWGEGFSSIRNDSAFICISCKRERCYGCFKNIYQRNTCEGVKRGKAVLWLNLTF